MKSSDNVENIYDYHIACLRTAPDGMSANNLLDNALLKSVGELGELFHSPEYPERDEFGDCMWYTSITWKGIDMLWERYLGYSLADRRRWDARDYCYDLSQVLYDDEGKSLINPSEWTKQETYFEISKHLSRCTESFGKFCYHCDGENSNKKKKKYLHELTNNFFNYERHLFLEAFRHDWSMVDIWKENIAKLEERYPDGFDPDQKN